MDHPHERWEHLIVLLEANAEKQQTYLEQKWPGRQFPPYTPQALIPRLDYYGDQGWELVAMQPVIMGDNGDILITTDFRHWSNQYLCTFKRRKRE
jgi:hypothetical protein